MTKKLEEEFNLPPIEEVTDTENVPTVQESQEVIEEVQGALSVSEKINLAFKEIKGLEDHEVEMNDIAKKAINSYQQLMDLGMNVSDMAAGKVFAEASNMLKIALDASDAKTKSNSLILKNSARVILATPAQLTAPIARVIDKTDDPNNATITMAKSKVGKT